MTNFSSIPKHVAIIMDGNGRWAQIRNKPRTFGHAEGVKILDDIASHAEKIGIKFLTLYAFSTENWNRSGNEVSFLMNLFENKLREYISDNGRKNKFKFNIIGSKNGLTDEILNLSDELVNKSATNNGITINIAFNYGSRTEIIDSVRKIASEYKNGQIKNINDINEEKFNEYLYTKGQPSVDLLIRTGGEMRISNFLLWQLSYAELIFTKVLWPDFSNNDFDEAIHEFNRRTRKFGAII